MSLELTKKSLADLQGEEWVLVLASIGTRRRNRPIDPVALAEMFTRTPWSNQEIAYRCSVTPRTVVMFKHLLKLPENIKELVRLQKVSIDEGDKLSSLRDTFSRQLLAKAIRDDAISADVISRVVPFKNRNPDVRIEDCINQVLKSRPRAGIRHVFVGSIEESINEALRKRAEQAGLAYLDFLRKVLEESLTDKDNLVSFVVHNGVCLLILTPRGWQALRRKSAELGVPLDEVVETVTRLWLEANS